MTDDSFWEKLLTADEAPVVAASDTSFKSSIRVAQIRYIAILSDKFSRCTFNSCGELSRYRLSGLTRCRKHLLEEVEQILDGNEGGNYQNRYDMENPI